LTKIRLLLTEDLKTLRPLRLCEKFYFLAEAQRAQRKNKKNLAHFASWREIYFLHPASSTPRLDGRGLFYYFGRKIMEF
jgi:hypothetical protein